MSYNGRGPAPVHYLRKNDAVWTPPAVIYFDTETRVIPDTEPEVLALRLWCATLIDRRPTRGGAQTILNGDGDTGTELAQWITTQSKTRPTLWVYAHNLSFDLTTTRLPLTLATLGWRISDAAVGGRAPWMRFGKGSSRLCIVDSGSWLPTKLEDIGTAVGIPKPSLPRNNGARPGWLARCRVDVDILASAMEQLHGWWDRNELGKWDITGPSCGWHAFRHVPELQRITVDPAAEAQSRDRLAIYGGRRGAWRIGKVSDGPLLELDFTAAYPTIAASCPLPVGRNNLFDSMAVDDWRITSDDYGIIARVEINTDQPLYPLKWGGQTWYPTGHFRTTLAGPDIRRAQQLGHLVSVSSGEVHKLGFAMQSWARWLLAVQNGTHEDSPPMARIFSKASGRTVIGKWAAHSFDKQDMGETYDNGWGYTEGWDDATNSAGGLVSIAGRQWWVSSGGDSDNGYPAILAFVESHTRQLLGRVIQALGHECVIQCDTDGLIVRAEGMGAPNTTGTLTAPDGIDGADRITWTLDQLNTIAAPLHIRIKRTFDTAHILGPQHVDAGGQRRFSGLRADAKHIGNDQYRGRTWPKLQYQLSNGDARGYVRPLVTNTIRGPYAPGWVSQSGRVVPPIATIDAHGTSVLLPWGLMPEGIQRLGLAQAQNPRLPLEWLDTTVPPPRETHPPVS